MSAAVPATFAAGCFWGTEKFFVKRFGAVLNSHEVGFMGGEGAVEVTYPMVKKGDTGHAEVLHVMYDPDKVTYKELLDLFFRIHNPTTLNRQANDIGTQYRSAIFFHNEEQLQEAKEYISRLNGADPTMRVAFVKAFGDVPVVTSLEKASQFYPAEEHHQQYLERNPNGYCAHRFYW